VKTLKILIAGLSLVMASQGAFAQGAKIGVLNALQALFNSDAARVVQQALDTEFAEDEARATSLTTELQELQQEYQQNEAVMTDEQKRRMNSNAQDLQVQLQLIQERVQTALQEQQQAFVNAMQGQLGTAVTEVVAEGGYDLILNAEAVPYFAPVLDITALVTAKLNELTSNTEDE